LGGVAGRGARRTSGGLTSAPGRSSVTSTEGPSLLVWEDLLPVRFMPGTPPSAERVVAHRIATNLRVLHTCEALEERRTQRDDDVVGSAETARLEKKIDLLIEMVGHWVAQSGARPPAVVAGLSAAGVFWSAADVHPPDAPSCAAGAMGTMEVYLREGVAEALRLPCRVVSVGDRGRVEVEFLGLSDVEIDALERFVFRQHRRAVAGRRKPL